MENPNFTTTSRPKSPVPQISLLNKMKRKRGDSAGPERSPVKRKIEHLSHVALPRPLTPMNTPNHIQQTSEYTSSTCSEAPSKTQPPKMDREKSQEGRANPAELAVAGSFDREQPELWKPLEGNGSQEESISHAVPKQKKQEEEKIDFQSGKTDTTAMATVQQVIESQFSLEILLKHRELRLVDQEIAKCQIALEQLRRCQIIPYPAMSSKLEDMQAVSGGSGPTFDNHVQYPPPWGVTDGPYTRHYQKWLIPDSAFDGSIAESPQAPRTGGKTVPERTTRGSVAEKSNIGHKSRSQRGSASARLQALPHGYPEPKEEKGPMILKRSTDGQWVKLVCIDCRRDNFNSAQGFINHCRIAHNRGFASHDAAAQACGEEIDYNPAVGVGVSGESTGVTSTSGTSVGLVHPLVRSAQMTRQTPTTTTASRRRKSQPQSAAGHTPESPSGFKANTSATPVWQRPSHPSGLGTPLLGPFTPSSQTPHLSALFAKTGWRGDLDEMVTEAKVKPDADADAHLLSEDEDQDQDMEDTSETTNDPQNLDARSVIRGGRLPARAGMSPAPLERTPSSKGINNGVRKPEFLSNIIPLSSYPSSCTGTPTLPQQQASPTEDVGPVLNLSPNTIESHPAPSLVSDDGDYENAHSDSEGPSSAEGDDEEDRYLGVEVEDHDEEIGLGGSSSAAADLGLGKPHPPTARIAGRPSTTRTSAPLQDQDLNDQHARLPVPSRRPRRKGMK